MGLEFSPVEDRPKFLKIGSSLPPPHPPHPMFPNNLSYFFYQAGQGLTFSLSYHAYMVVLPSLGALSFYTSITWPAWPALHSKKRVLSQRLHLVYRSGAGKSFPDQSFGAELSVYKVSLLLWANFLLLDIGRRLCGLREGMVQCAPGSCR